jgi:hypothetical protein
VVRYYQSWIDFADEGDEDGGNEEDEDEFESTEGSTEGSMSDDFGSRGSLEDEDWYGTEITPSMQTLGVAKVRGTKKIAWDYFFLPGVTGERRFCSGERNNSSNSEKGFDSLLGNRFL